MECLPREVGDMSDIQCLHLQCFVADPVFQNNSSIDFYCYFQFLSLSLTLYFWFKGSVVLAVEREVTVVMHKANNLIKSLYCDAKRKQTVSIAKNLIELRVLTTTTTIRKFHQTDQRREQTRSVEFGASH